MLATATLAVRGKEGGEGEEAFCVRAVGDRRFLGSHLSTVRDLEP
jgi:hypothetical protein